jgi:hypothetical protein
MSLRRGQSDGSFRRAWHQRIVLGTGLSDEILISDNSRIQFELRGVWSLMEKSRLFVVRSVALVRHSNKLVPFFREWQNPGAEFHSSLATLGMPRFARLARCEYLVSNPNERTEAPL